MGSLQQIHAFHLNSRRQCGNIGRAVEWLSQNHFTYRFAGAMGHGADIGGDRSERRGFTFAPACQAARRHAHQQGILTAIARIGYDGHRQIEEIDSFNIHGALIALGTC